MKTDGEGEPTGGLPSIQKDGTESQRKLHYRMERHPQAAIGA